MLLSVLIYVTAVTSLLAGAAWILESAASGREVPTRFIWAGVVGGAIVSLGVAVGGETAPAVDGAPDFQELAALVMPEPVASAAPGTAGMMAKGLAAPLSFAIPQRADSLLLVAWLLLSSALLVLVCSAQVRLFLERRRWSTATVDGRRVLVAADRGPAVVGVARPVVVVPRWLLDMTVTQRDLMLRHEDEHRAAGDSRLVAAAVAALVLLPWNVPLWWAVARLRVALEIDCDRRVLKTVPDVRPYASLLIDIGAREAPSRLASVAFSSSFSFLERRIKAMTDTHPRATFRAVLLGALASLLISGACYVERVDVRISDEPSDVETKVEALDLLRAEVRALEELIGEREASAGQERRAEEERTRETAREEAALRGQQASSEANFRDQFAAAEEYLRVTRLEGLGEQPGQPSVAEAEISVRWRLEAHQFALSQLYELQIQRLRAEHALEAEGPGERRADLARVLEQLRARAISLTREHDQSDDMLAFATNELRALKAARARQEAEAARARTRYSQFIPRSDSAAQRIALDQENEVARHVPPRIFLDVVRAMPDDTWLRQVSYASRDQSGIRITGHAGSIPVAVVYVANLEASPVFRSVAFDLLRTTTSETDPNGVTYEFEIVATYENGTGAPA